jgi:hypothetical protein
MSKSETKAYFTNEELIQLNQVQGKILKKVIIHLWQNNVDKNHPVELIDNLLLIYGNDEKLTICSDQERGSLCLNEFHYEAEKEALKAEFQEKIRIIRIDASTTKMWSDLIGKEITGIQLAKEHEHYLSDSILLIVGDEQRTIALNPLDGLLIDLFEAD